MTAPGAPVDADALDVGKRRRRILAGGVALAAAGLGAGTALWRHRVAPEGGDEALDPVFWTTRLERPEGGELDLASLRGRPTLVNFWATWCPPCVEELPLLDAFFREQRASGWQVVGLAIDRPDAVRRFLGTTPVSFPVGIAGLSGTDLVRRLGNTAGGLPFTLVLGADGRVAVRKMGRLDRADLTAWRSRLHG